MKAMRCNKLRFLVSLLAGAALAAPWIAVAQNYPVKPVRLIIAHTPGTTADTVGRIMGPEMSKILGQPVVIENKPGANSKLGYEYVAAQAPADGYTFVIVNGVALALFPATVKDLQFDPLKDLPPFIGLGEQRYVLGSSAKVPWKTFNELVARAKANPGKFNFGSASTSTRLTVEALVRALALNVVHVPYASGGTYLNALVGGEVHMGITSEGRATAWGDKFRVLAVTGSERLAALPDAPTFAELGFPQIPGLDYSMNVRVGTPKTAVDKLHAAASQTLQQPEVKAMFEKLQMEPERRAPEALQRRFLEQAKSLTELTRQLGIQPQ